MKRHLTVCALYDRESDEVFFLSLPWSPEQNLVLYNSEEVDLEPGKEGIRYTSGGLGYLIRD